MGDRGKLPGVQLSDDPVRRVSLRDELRDYAGVGLMLLFGLLLVLS